MDLNHDEVFSCAKGVAFMHCASPIHLLTPYFYCITIYILEKPVMSQATTVQSNT